MLEAPLRRQAARALIATLVPVSAACGQSPSAPAPGPSDVSLGGAGNATGAQATGGDGSPGGGTISPTGGVGSLGSAAGASSPGEGGMNAGSAGAPTGGLSPTGGAAGATSGAAGTASGGSGGEATYSTDPATFGGEPRCQGLAICESFESTELGGLPSGFTLQGYGTRKVGASADRAMRGARSLRLEIAAQGAVTSWLTRGSLGALGARHFGRAFFRIDGPAPTEFVHFDLFEASGPFEGHENLVRYASTGTGVGTSQSNWSFIYNVQPSGSGAGAEFGSEGDRSAHPRVDDWMCLEWSFDASKQTAQYYLDGAAIDYLGIDIERAEIPVFDSLAVGFGKYQNTGAFLVYIDEVAFDGERIGCNN